MQLGGTKWERTRKCQVLSPALLGDFFAASFERTRTKHAGITLPVMLGMVSGKRAPKKHTGSQPKTQR
jgi:hypothetical protein